MTAYKVMAHIDSLDGEIDEITIIDKVDNNKYIADYKGVKCYVLFNCFSGHFYADNVFGRVIEENGSYKTAKWWKGE